MEIEIKTTREIYDLYKSIIKTIPELPKLEKELITICNQKWYSEEELRLKLLDMYRFMCNEYGKANIWSMNTDELLDNVDLLIEKKLFNAPDKQNLCCQND